MLNAFTPANNLARNLDRWSIATRGAFYAGSTLVALTTIQWLVLQPGAPIAKAALVVPVVICTSLTYLIARAMVRRRTQALTDMYLRFARGRLDDDILATDPEFRQSRELFLRLSRELEQATRALTERDAERRRLFSDVVHELGTPVSSLLGLAEALERPELTGTPEQLTRVARAVGHESERLARFVEDLRDLAQLDDPAMTLHREPVDLAVVAREVVERLNAIPDATCVQLDASSVLVSADSSRLEQIIVNLVTNARRYALPPAIIKIAVTAADGRARLLVEDGGPGVADADLPKLGERMRRLDKSRARKTGGTGLGLSIVSAIADKHGGLVRFRRSALGGLAVEVELTPTRGSA